MPQPNPDIQETLRLQRLGTVRLLGRHVVWRRASGEYAVWPERNIYSPVPPGCVYSLDQAVVVLSKEIAP